MTFDRRALDGISIGDTGPGSPLRITVNTGGPGDWVLSNQTVDASGRAADAARPGSAPASRRHRPRRTTEGPVQVQGPDTLDACFQRPQRRGLPAARRLPAGEPLLAAAVGRDRRCSSPSPACSPASASGGSAAGCPDGRLGSSTVLLALDTATPAVTVARRRRGPGARRAHHVDARRHGELLAPAIADGARRGRRRPPRAHGGRRRHRPGPVHRAAGRPGHGADAGRGARHPGARRLHPRRARAGRRAWPASSGWSPTPAAARCTGRRTAPAPAGPERLDGPYVACARRLRPAPVRRSAPVPSSTPTRSPATRGPQHPAAADLARWVAARAARRTAPDPLYLRRPDAAEPGARKSVLSRPQP